MRRTFEGRENDCSKGLGSRSKSERVCLTSGGCGLTSGEVAVSPFFGGVEDMMVTMMTMTKAERRFEKRIGSKR